MTNLATTYLGLALKNPLVVSASPLTEDLEKIKRMEEAGAAAVVMHSLFEEQITLQSNELDCHVSKGAESHSQALSYFQEMGDYKFAPEAYLDHIHRAKQAVGIPIIGSLNGVSTGTWNQWSEYARKIEEAGADALELSIYFIPTDPQTTGPQIEAMYLELTQAIRKRVRIPLAVKIEPHFSSIIYMARQLEQAGANGLVLFNRFFQPDFDIEGRKLVPRLSLSHPTELLLRLHWVAILFPHLKADLAVTGGVHGAVDVIKAIMAGARVTMMTSALLQHGIEFLKRVQTELVSWLDQHSCNSLGDLHGCMSTAGVPVPAALKRASYLQMLNSCSPPR